MNLSEQSIDQLKQKEQDIKSQTMLFPLIVFVLAMIIGSSTVFYHFVEKWGWLNSLYYTVVTMATVGYGDFVPTKNESKVFTMFLIVFGIGTFTIFITQLIKRQGLKMASKRLYKAQKPIEEGVKIATQKAKDTLHF